MLSQDISFLYGLYREGIKLDLSMTRDFAARLGNPERKFKSIHVAGTNGKGSTSAYIYNILQEKHSAGLYTSPHLVRFNERVIANHEPITDQEISDFVVRNRDLISELSRENRNPTFFEATTVMAFKHFEEKGVEYASVEVGLGGRLDSTNIITPEASVITQVGYEHADKLGCSLTSIAYEKGGIIKQGVPVILADEKPEVVRTISSLAQSRKSRLVRAQKDSVITDLEQGLAGSSFRLSTPGNDYEIKTSIVGRYQPRNIASAVLAIENSGTGDITRGQVESGVRKCRWPGRVDVIRRDPVTIADGAHNPPAANALRLSLADLGIRNPTLVVGMLADKDSFSFLRIMRQISGRVIFTSPDEPMRAIPPGKLQALSSGIFPESSVIEDPIDAYEKAVSDSDSVVVTGSLYLVGTIMEHEKLPVMPYSQD